MTQKERLELAQWAAEAALNAGADQAAVKVAGGRSVDVEFRDGRIEKLQESTQSSLALTLYAGKRYSTHSTSDTRREFLAGFIKEAVAMTKYLAQDEHRALPDPKLYEGRQELELRVRDPGWEAMETTERIRVAREIETAARAESDRVISVTSGFGDALVASAQVHTNGFVGERESTVFYAGAEATVRDDAGGRPEDWDYATVRLRNDLPAPEGLGRNAVRNALRKIGQGKVESGLYDMVVHNRGSERLVSALVGPMSARALQQKSSFLDGMLGKSIGSESLTLTDSPFLPGGLGSRLFDDEGIAAVARVVVEKGVLRSYYVDDYYGRKLGMDRTSGSTSNLVLAPGSSTPEQLVAGVKKGILVTQFLGGNSNSTTGDFSFGIAGQLIADGKLVRPVNEMNISGNLRELWTRLAAAGNDPYRYSAWRIPSLLFTGIQFSGM